MISQSQIVAHSGKGLDIVIGDAHFDHICDTYAQIDHGGALALYGSLDTLEIAVNGGSAAQVLGIGVGDEVRVRFLS